MISHLLEIDLPEHSIFDCGIALCRVRQNEVVDRLALRRFQFADRVPPTGVEHDLHAGLRLERLGEVLLKDLVESRVDEDRDRSLPLAAAADRRTGCDCGYKAASRRVR